MEGVKPATRLVVNEEKFRTVMVRQGFKNVEMITERAKELGIPLGIGTVYGVMQNRNYQRESLERIAEILEVDLSEFVEFQPES